MPEGASGRYLSIAARYSRTSGIRVSVQGGTTCVTTSLAISLTPFSFSACLSSCSI